MTGSYGAWSKTCGTDAVRTRSVQCVRSGGTSVTAVRPETECTNPKPGAQEGPTTVVESCTYSPAYGSYGPCSNNVRTAQIESCTRSDGVSVDKSQCGGHPQQITQSCSFSCGTLAANTASTGPTLAHLGNVTSATEARVKCEEWGAANQQATGVCIYDGSKAYFNAGFPMTHNGIYSASMCRN